MTRKDFVLIAGALAEARRNANGMPHVLAGIDHAALEMASALRSTNPNFNRERFLAAARGEPMNGRDRPR